ncbi:MAG: polysaccharide deacetylase family protein [Faecalibacterium sp.]|nr:polysaccharide deacetylase family protein [Ruminococcus sp.]MCM1391372.1 polysaccharide deacetylase family protein [Ruminococcus sp.]MCM1484582.1 polysaccharide deacetylase family protein [Faecalibacterium sp.]
MKKIICLCLSLVLIFSLCACGDDNTITNRPSDLTPTEDAPNDTTVSERVSTDGESQAVEKQTEIEISQSDAIDYNVGEDMIITGIKGAGTETGFAPLDKVTYSVADPNNTRGLSTKKVSHSHGPASGGEPHHTVVAFQDTFDKYGALTLDRTSGQKVLYLTFDCGWEYENLTSTVLDTLKEKNVPAIFFCTLDHIKKQPELIKRMIAEGHIVGNHSNTHPSFATINRTQMAKEIQDTENYLRENFGYAAKYFRFPAGEYNESALDLVSSLGYMSVFWSVAYNDWNVNEIKGKDYAVETVLSRLHSGAVILLHSVSKDNAAALGEIIDKAREQGYEFKALTDYRINA